jgi:hypothetical protein
MRRRHYHTWQLVLELGANERPPVVGTRDAKRIHCPSLSPWRCCVGPPPPWHFAGDALAVEFWNDPDVSVQMLPTDVELDEAGLDLAVAANASLGVSWSGQFADQSHSNAVKGNFSWRF